MKIEVKCERCRFRFMTEAEPGMSELTCVCPRCGTPFTVQVNPDEIPQEPVEAEEHVEELVQEKKTIVPPPAPKQKEPVQTPQPTKTASTTSRPQWLRNEMPPRPQQAEKPKRKRHTLLKILGGLIILYFFITFMVYKCSNHSDRIEEAPQVTAGGSTASDDNDENVVDTTEADEFTRVDAKPAPDWLQGTWTVQTVYGHITVRIDSNHISETIAYNKDGEKREETSEGTFYFADERLYCDGMSDDNHQMTYDLDLAHHCIMLGNKPMKKQ